MTTRKDIHAAIGRERGYQDRKWGNNPHTVGEWILILEAEIRESKDAWVKKGGDVSALAEILQVAAVAVAALEQHGIVERAPEVGG